MERIVQSILEGSTSISSVLRSCQRRERLVIAEAHRSEEEEEEDDVDEDGFEEEQEKVSEGVETKQERTSLSKAIDAEEFINSYLKFIRNEATQFFLRQENIPSETQQDQDVEPEHTDTDNGDGTKERIPSSEGVERTGRLVERRGPFGERNLASPTPMRRFNLALHEMPELNLNHGSRKTVVILEMPPQQKRRVVEMARLYAGLVKFGCVENTIDELHFVIQCLCLVEKQVSRRSGQSFMQDDRQKNALEIPCTSSHWTLFVCTAITELQACLTALGPFVCNTLLKFTVLHSFAGLFMAKLLQSKDSTTLGWQSELEGGTGNTPSSDAVAPPSSALRSSSHSSSCASSTTASLGFSLPFRKETDSRLHFNTRELAKLFSNRESVRDSFFKALRTFRESKNKLAPSSASSSPSSSVSLPSSSKASSSETDTELVLEEQIRACFAALNPLNMYWLAQFFVSELLLVCATPPSEQDKKISMLAKDQQKLAKLQARFRDAPIESGTPSTSNSSHVDHLSSESAARRVPEHEGEQVQETSSAGDGVPKTKSPHGKKGKGSKGSGKSRKVPMSMLGLGAPSSGSSPSTATTSSLASSKKPNKGNVNMLTPRKSGKPLQRKVGPSKTFSTKEEEASKQQGVAKRTPFEEALFPNDEAFFFRFLSICDSHRFSSLLQVVLLSELLKLDTPLEIKSLSSSNPTHYTRRVVAARLLARFWGYLVFSPNYFTNDQAFAGASLAFNATLIEAVEATDIAKGTPMHIVLDSLENSRQEGTLAFTVAWVCSFLQTLQPDQISRASHAYHQCIEFLRSVRHSLGREATVSLFLTCQVEQLFLALGEPLFPPGVPTTTHLSVSSETAQIDGAALKDREYFKYVWTSAESIRLILIRTLSSLSTSTWVSSNKMHVQSPAYDSNPFVPPSEEAGPFAFHQQAVGKKTIQPSVVRFPSPTRSMQTGLSQENVLQSKALNDQLEAAFLHQHPDVKKSVEFCVDVLSQNLIQEVVDGPNEHVRRAVEEALQSGTSNVEFVAHHKAKTSILQDIHDRLLNPARSILENACPSDTPASVIAAAVKACGRMMEERVSFLLSNRLLTVISLQVDRTQAELSERVDSPEQPSQENHATSPNPNRLSHEKTTAEDGSSTLIERFLVLAQSQTCSSEDLVSNLEDLVAQCAAEGCLSNVASWLVEQSLDQDQDVKARAVFFRALSMVDPNVLAGVIQHETIADGGQQTEISATFASEFVNTFSQTDCDSFARLQMESKFNHVLPNCTYSENWSAGILLL